MTTTNGRRVWLIATCLSTAGATAAPASAQNALGDGRSLESRKVSNQPAPQTTTSRRLEDQIRFNNNIATGQAGAGRSFQGSMGYRGTDEFQATLGSESLFTFRRETNVANALAGSGLRSSDALRFQTGLSTGQGAPPIAAALFSDRRGTVASSDTLSALRSPSQHQARSSMMPTVLGYRTLEGVGPLVITASPLRGMGWVSLDPRAATDPGSAQPGDPSGPSSLISPNTAGLSGLERVARGVTAVSESRQFREGQDRAQLAAPAGGGQRIDQRLSTADDGYGQAMQVVSKALSQRIVDPGTPAAPPKPEAGGAAPPSGAGAGAKDANDAAAAARPAWLDELDALRKKMRKDRQQPKAKEPERLNPVTGQMEPVSAPGGAPAALTAGNNRVVDALRDAEANVVMFVQPGKTSADIYEARMAEGQRLLGVQRYFDAEASFTVAAAARRNDPMALVGRAHAQLGAGLFLSAAANLREVLTAHPELLSVRYGPLLLPPPDRAQTLAEHLRADLTGEAGALGRDGALLLTYLGRQFSNANWLSTGLSEARARLRPDDAEGEVFITLLERVWGGAKP
ncbi:MAG: hypothetical protein ACKVS8_08665 [Phycisphaerales bacterium]